MGTCYRILVTWSAKTQFIRTKLRPNPDPKKKRKRSSLWNREKFDILMTEHFSKKTIISFRGSADQAPDSVFIFSSERKIESVFRSEDGVLNCQEIL